MAQTSLGQEIQKLRRRKGISQKELSDCMGWNSTAPLVSIEKDRRIPEAETISRIVECTEGTFADECRLLGLGGYLPSMPIPTISQIKSELTVVCEHIRTARYPLYITDFRFSYWVGNPAIWQAFRAVNSPESLRMIIESRITTLDLIFDSQLPIQPLIVNLPTMLRDQVRLFKANNVYRQHEAFYQEYPEIMRKHLLPDDYAAFQYAWESTTANNIGNPLDAFNYLVIAVDGHPIEFQLSLNPASWSGGFFNLMNCIPRDTPDNRSLMQAIFPPAEDTQEQCIKLWEVIAEEQLEQMLKAYKAGLPIVR